MEENPRTIQIEIIGLGGFILAFFLALAVFIAYLFFIPDNISHSPSIYVKQVTQNEITAYYR